jgi:cytochrome b pre-mRNA-processing protein 3
MLNILRRIAAEKRAASRLYGAVAERSRDAAFYRSLGVEDTFDGRFDLVVLHAWMVLDALKRAELGDLEQRFLQLVFEGFEDGLRDQGAGDMGIGRRSKAMTSALFGRIRSYEAAADREAMADALCRNLYRDVPGKRGCACAMADYISESRKTLATSDLAEGAAAFSRMTEHST